MSVETYIAYLATVAIFFATPPGPSQILMITNSLRHGARRSTATIAGDLSANALQMAAAGFGLTALIADSALSLAIVKWLGVGYLAYVGIRTFIARPASPDRNGQGATAVPLRTLWLQGFLTSASNPKAVFFFAALFPQFLDPAAPMAPQLLALGTTYLVIDGILLVLWGAGAERVLARLRAGPRLLNRVSGGMMLTAAGLLALKSPEAVR